MYVKHFQQYKLNLITNLDKQNLNLNYKKREV